MSERELTTEQRLKDLRAKQVKSDAEVTGARKKYLEARAHKHAAETRAKRISSEIELLEQGQLCLGDFGATA